MLQDIASSYPFPEFLEPISDGHFWDEIPERKYCIDSENFHHNPVPEGLKAQLCSLLLSWHLWQVEWIGSTIISSAKDYHNFRKVIVSITKTPVLIEKSYLFSIMFKEANISRLLFD